MQLVVGQPLDIEKRGKGDGSGEIKRVENFFSSSSPLPATPGITCPVLNITRERERERGGGDSQQHKGNLQKKKQDALTICPLSADCLSAKLREIQTYSLRKYYQTCFWKQIWCQIQSLVRSFAFEGAISKEGKREGGRKPFKNYCQNSQRWETDKEVCCLPLFVLAMSAKVFLPHEVEWKLWSNFPTSSYDKEQEGTLPTVTATTC